MAIRKVGSAVKTEGEVKMIREEIEDAYPLSMLQAGMLFHSDYTHDSVTYHDVISYTIRLPFDRAALEQAVQQATERHEVLRTSIDVTKFREPVQIVHRRVHLPVFVEDLRAFNEEEQRNRLSNWLKEETRKGFRWNKPPLFRIYVHRLQEELFQWSFSFHHAILDGWSEASLIAELLQRYDSLRNGKSLPVTKLQGRYRDYIALERKALESETSRLFWGKILANYRPTPIPFAATVARSDHKGSHAISVEEPVWEELRKLATQAGLPFKSVLLAGHMKVLSLLNGYKDITAGIVLNGRPEVRDGDEMLGLFLNSVPFRLEVTGTWMDLARAAFETEQRILPHRRYPMAALKQQAGRGALFECAFNYLHFHVYGRVLGQKQNVILKRTGFAQNSFPFLANFEVLPDTQTMRSILEFAPELLNPENASRVTACYERVFRAMAEAPARRHDATDDLVPAERQQVLGWSASSDPKETSSQSLQEMLELQIERQRDAVAVTSGAQAITYGELGERAARLANLLSSKGAGPETVVALYLDRSIEMVIGMVGVLQAGAAHVLLDPQWPAERLRHIFRDVSGAIVLTHSSVANRLPEEWEERIYLDMPCEIAHPSPLIPCRIPQPENLAYVAYGPGVIGAPKGTAISFDGLRNLILWHLHKYNLSTNDRVTQSVPLEFDAIEWEIWPALIAGASINIVANPAGEAASQLLQDLERQQITIAFLPAPLADQALSYSWPKKTALRQLLVGCESLWRFPGSRLPFLVANHYGPAENTVIATSCTLDKWDVRQSSPIGRPIANTCIYVLDESGNLAPAGVTGQLYIGGSALSRGYFNHPEWTAESFVPHPFTTAAGQRLYRTGDLVRYLEDGGVEYRGRIDRRITIQGYRIEPAEIETALKDHPGVQDAVVIVHEERRGESRLAAYVTGQNGATPEKDDLKSHLIARLRPYMVPETVVILEGLPLDANGELDRQALPSPNLDLASTRAYEAPAGEIESKVADLWMELLKPERIGRYDDFFQLGGRSLLAVQVIARLREMLKVEVAIRDLFEHPTLADFASYLEGAIQAQLLPITPTPRNRPIPLSFAQQRLWFLAQVKGASEAYHMPLRLRLRGRLDRTALRQTLDGLVLRHESLRTSFPFVNGEPVQRILSGQEAWFHLVEHDLRTKDDAQAELDRLITLEREESFVLELGPLIRGRLIQLAADEHVLLITMHHIISDGWSLGILLREVSAFYRAFLRGEKDALPELTVQYADYAAWQREWFQGEVAQKHLTYWLQQLSGLPQLKLPLDKPRPPFQNFAGKAELWSAPQEMARELREFCHSHGITVFMLLIAALQILLYRITGEEDFAVGTGSAGRHHKEVEGVIGFFVNTLVFRADLRGNPTFDEVLERVRSFALAAYAHDAMPFDKLVEALQPNPIQDRNPLFQVALVLENMPGFHFELEHLVVSPVKSETWSSPFDICLFVYDHPDCLDFIFEYRPDLFNAETIQKWARMLQDLVVEMIKHPEQRIRDYSALATEVGAFLGIAAQSVAPLSLTQRDLFLDSLVHPESTTYSLAVSADLGPFVDPARWEEAARKILARQQIARTVFCQYGNDFLQVITRDAHVHFSHVDLASGSDTGSALDDFVCEKCKIQYDLQHGPLLHNFLLRNGANGFVAVVAAPHILLDASSSKLLLEQISKAYEEVTIETDHKTFCDYTAPFSAQFDTPAVRQFWSHHFQRATALQLSSVPRRGQPISRSVLIDGHLSDLLRQYCDFHGHSVARFFRALLGYLIYVYFRPSHSFVAYDIAGGRADEFAETLGCFYHIVPNVFQPEWFFPGNAVPDILEAVRTYRQDLGSNQYISVSLQRELLREESLKFIYNFYDFSQADLLGRKVPVVVHDSFPADEVHFIVREVHDSIEIALHYNDGYFSDLHLLERMKSLVQQVVNGKGLLFQLELQIAGEQLTLEQWSCAAAEFPVMDCIHELFEIQAQRTPDAIAITHESTQLSYGELNRRANQLAHHLRQLGVTPQSYVAICLERSAEMVVAVLAVLKAGGAYVPLDPAHPSKRLIFMLADSKPAVLLTRAEISGRFSTLSEKPAIVDVMHHEVWQSQPETNLRRSEAGLTPANPAYVIYTSGSTGTPKGVVVAHENVLRLFYATEEYFHFDSQDIWTLFHSYGFDFSVWEIWGALLFGGRLVIVPKEVTHSPDDFYKLVCERNVTILNHTPSAFRPLIVAQGRAKESHQLRRVIFGGESLDPSMLIPWYERNQARTQLINMYGITETTVHVTYHALSYRDVEERGGSPIGARIPDLETYILDPNGLDLPIGVTGELYVGGPGVAHGYLNSPELTAERFLPAPKAKRPGSRIYRTGDLGQWADDGTIKFLGRNDFQVKIRGFRIEVGEIEAQLARYPGIQEAAVIARGDMDGKRLVAYYTISKSHQRVPPPTAEELRAYLAGTLPEYMIPAAYMRLDFLPLTLNGKLDRKALPAPDAGASAAREYEAPQGHIENTLAAIWSELLEIEYVGRQDNFFELGGHSLLAAQAVSRIRNSLDMELPLQKLFENPTIISLAQALAKEEPAGETKTGEIVRVTRNATLPLSYAQRRLWFLEQLQPGGEGYNIFMPVQLNGPLDAAALERALQEIVKRHEVLRTRLASVMGEPVQIVETNWELKLQQIDLSDLAEEERKGAILRIIREDAAMGFDLSRGPLLRATLLRTNDKKHIFILNMHHIVADEWSLGILKRELKAFYQTFSSEHGENGGNAEFLPPLKKLGIQYADFAVWQRDWLQREELQKHLIYWETQLAELPPISELLVDHSRPPVKGSRGAVHTLAVGEDVLERLKALSLQEGTTLFMTLLAGVQILLWRYTNAEDIVVGSPIASRNRTELEPLIGFFVNMLVLRTRVSAGTSFRNLLRNVRQTTLEAYSHQDMPFELLVDRLSPIRDLSRTPLFQITFAQVGANSETPLELPGIEARWHSHSEVTSTYDLSITATERGRTLVLGFRYDTDLYNSSTIQRVGKHLRQLLAQAVLAPDNRIAQVEWLDESERQQLIYEWSGVEGTPAETVLVNDLIQIQAAQQPDGVAIVEGERKLTYGELDRRANQLAHYLRRRGLYTEMPVGVYLERSIEMVVALVGILKAGAAYVPLDVELPSERVNYMVENGGITTIITVGQRLDRLSLADTVQVICIDQQWDEINREANGNVSPMVASPANAAYIIFTSGSTGQPKGVLIPHAGLANFVKWHWRNADVAPEDRVAQMCAVGFDASVFEMWPHLCAGASLHIVDEEGRSNPARLAKWIATQDITIAFLPTLLAEQTINEPALQHSCLRAVLTGGDRLRKLSPSGAKFAFWNHYGPTEATVAVSAGQVPSQENGSSSPHIGRSIAHTRLYILDNELQPAGIGVPGELFIAGIGMARGYVKRPDLTADKFIPNPFPAESGERMYRTGDFVRWQEDGNIEFLGRKDQQVKVRGYRIELAEVESVLMQHSEVREAVVASGGDAEERRLIGYVVANHGSTLDGEQLRGFLRDRLPTYMVPAVIVMLNELPLNSSGKLDRRALPMPEPKTNTEAAGFCGPQTATEATLVGIWKDVLGLDQVGIHNDFFALGGNSQLSAHLIKCIADAFNVDLPLRMLFEHPTVAAFAKALQTASTKDTPAVKRAESSSIAINL